MMKALKSMEVEHGPSSKIIQDFGSTPGNLDKDCFLTSTPRRLEIVCNECKRLCQKNQHMKIHMKANIWDPPPPDISSIDPPDD